MDPKTPQPATAPPAPKKFCQMCREQYDEEKDPYHLENCRDAQKP